MKRPYVTPWESGNQSTRAAVARRLGRLLDALDTEINGYVVQPSGVLDDLTVFRRKFVTGIKRDGWELSWGANNRAKVRPPKGGK